MYENPKMEMIYIKALEIQNNEKIFQNAVFDILDSDSKKIWFLMLKGDMIWKSKSL